MSSVCIIEKNEITTFSINHNWDIDERILNSVSIDDIRTIHHLLIKKDDARLKKKNKEYISGLLSEYAGRYYHLNEMYDDMKDYYGVSFDQGNHRVAEDMITFYQNRKDYNNSFIWLMKYIKAGKYYTIYINNPDLGQKYEKKAFSELMCNRCDKEGHIDSHCNLYENKELDLCKLCHDSFEDTAIEAHRLFCKRSPYIVYPDDIHDDTYNQGSPSDDSDQEDSDEIDVYL